MTLSACRLVSDYNLISISTPAGSSKLIRGSIDNSNEKSYLGMLYKGKGTADLDSCIYYANYVIDQDGHYSLESDYGKLFSHPLMIIQMRRVVR